MKRVVVALLFVAAAGCQTVRVPSKPIVEFPTPTALATVEAKTVEVPAISAAPIPDEGWTVDAAQVVTSFAEPWSPQSAWDAAFAQVYAASGRKATVTRAMSCLAGEIARFRARQQDAPPEALQRFMAASCGVFVPSVGYHLLAGAVPRAVKDAEVLARWGRGLGPELLDKAPQAAREVGFAVSRAGGRVVVLLAYSTQPLHLQTLSLVPDPNGDVVVEGRFEGEVGHFAGYINDGRFAVRPCLVDPAMPRPAFRVVCRMSAKDDTAWLQIAFARPRRVLMAPLVQALIRRDVTQPLVFPRVPATGAVSDPSAFTRAALDGLNEVRAQGGLKPVRLAQAQSQRATGLARQFFAAALAKDPSADADVIALGLLAGWDVVGTIRHGGFYSAIVPNTRDPAQWLEATLAMPMGRDTMMDPNVDEVAIGPALFGATEAVGAVVTSYQFQRDNDHTADVTAIYERIAAARKRKNLPPPVRFGMERLVRAQLEGVQAGDETPESALDNALRIAADRMDSNMRGLVVEVTSLDALELPPEVLDRKKLHLEIGVTHYKPPGAAWSQLVILVIYVDAMFIKA